MEIPPEQNRLDELTATVAALTRRQYEAERRISQLEAITAQLRPTVLSPVVQAAAPVEPIAPPVEPPIVAETAEPIGPTPIGPPPLPIQREPVLETKLGLTLLNRIGVITLVVGVGFFFKWAVDSNLIGPVGRVILGVLAGFAALGVADWLWRKGQEIFAQGVTGAGVAILYLSFYAAYDFYHLIPQALAFVLMFVATGMTVALALRYNSSAVAALGLAGGYLTPILLSTGERRPWFLFSYVLILDIGAMLLARKRQSWQALELLGFTATVVYYGAWVFSVPPSERFVGTVAILAYYALYWFASVRAFSLVAQLLTAVALAIVWQGNIGAYLALELAVIAGGLAKVQLRAERLALPVTVGSFWLSYALWHNNYGHASLSIFAGITAVFLLFHLWSVRRFNTTKEAADPQSLVVLVLNGVAYFGAAYELLHLQYHAYLGLLAVAVAGTYLSFGMQLYRKYQSSGQSTEPVMLALGTALSFLTLAIPVQFTGYTVTLSWAIEAAALTWIGSRLQSRRAMLGAVVVFGFVSIRLLVFDAEMYTSSGAYGLLFNARFLTFFVAAVCLILAAKWAVRMAREIALGEYIAGLIVLLAGLSLEVIGWAERLTPTNEVLSVETVGLSILFAAYALALVGIGVWRRTVINRVAGLVLMGIVIVKLYLFDVWQLDRVYRISAFVVLGLLLISTSFLYSRFRRIVEGWLKDDEAGS